MQIGCKPFFHTVEEGAVQGGKGGRPCPAPPFVALGSSVRHNDSATFCPRGGGEINALFKRGRAAGREPVGPTPLPALPPAEWLHFIFEGMMFAPEYASESELTTTHMSLLLAAALLRHLSVS